VLVPPTQLACNPELVPFLGVHDELVSLPSPQAGTVGVGVGKDLVSEESSLRGCDVGQEIPLRVIHEEAVAVYLDGCPTSLPVGRNDEGHVTMRSHHPATRSSGDLFGATISLDGTKLLFVNDAASANALDIASLPTGTHTA